MTPYAILGCRPLDTDETIRCAYHKFARHSHPDARLGLSAKIKEKLEAEWYTATTAYSAIKTLEKRADWDRQKSLLSGVCKKCTGDGVTGSRLAGGKIRVCSVCDGEGRL